MSKPKKTTIALIYDFDGTLSPKNMQEYDFLKAIGITDKEQFWKENGELATKNDASNILCYMKLMIDKARASGVSVKKKQFMDFGAGIDLYDGVKEWFSLINKLGNEIDVKIEHYINSSGLKEMIEGTSIAKEFKEIYACSFIYQDDIAVWPGVAVDFTAKTQFLFMINKGISKISDNNLVNEFKKEEDRPIPFRQMIYFGDGQTDIPCMKLVKAQGGNSIAVYKPYNSNKKRDAKKLVHDNRVNFACSANYSQDGDLYKIVEKIIRFIKADDDLRMLQKRNLDRF